MKVYFAPLEGITGYIYRNAYETLYGHVDKYYAPFISPSDKYAMIPKERKDLLPENNEGIVLVPQILTNKSNNFIDAAKELEAMGYKEINLNLGCPSGTVCSKGKGAGFLPETASLDSFLEDIYSYADNAKIKISLKTRLGFYDAEEFYDLVEIFNKYPVSELIIHPRIRSDFYKGEPRLEYYQYALEHAKAPLVYNGNIFSKRDLDEISSKLNAAPDTIMLGRGLISKSGLINELESSNTTIDYSKFWELHDTVYHEYQKIMSPDINVLYKMKELWTYWRVMFEDSDKDIKKLLKTKKYAEYEDILRKIKAI